MWFLNTHSCTLMFMCKPHLYLCYKMVDLCVLCVLLETHMLIASVGSLCRWGVGPAVESEKGSNHKHLNLQMALMSCAKQPVLTDEPVNPG